VVIEPLHAHSANVAMTAAKGFYHLALSANLIRIEFLKNVDKLNVFGWLKHTWVLSRSHDKRNEHFDADHRSGNGIVPSRVVYKFMNVLELTREENEPQNKEDGKVQSPEEDL
jgi:hypothetical protein